MATVAAPASRTANDCYMMRPIVTHEFEAKLWGRSCVVGRRPQAPCARGECGESDSLGPFSNLREMTARRTSRLRPFERGASVCFSLMKCAPV